MNEFDRYGCVESDDNNFVTAFIQKKGYKKSGNINGGIYLSIDIFDNFMI